MKFHRSLTAILSAAALALPASAEDEKLPFLGVATTNVHPTLAAQLELDENTGLAVGNVVPDSPAAKAGIREHDILAAFDGTALTSPAQLRELVMTRKVGDEVKVTLIRRASEETVSVTLAELPQGLAQGERPPFPDDGPFGEGLPGGFDFKRMPGGFHFDFGGGAGGVPDVDKIFEDMMKRIDPDGVRGFTLPKIPFGEGAAATSSHSSVSIDDGTHKIEMDTRDGISTLKAYDSSGKLLYDGPCTTEEDKAAIPEEIRKKLDNIRSDFRVLPGAPDRAPAEPDDAPPVPTQKRTI